MRKRFIILLIVILAVITFTACSKSEEQLLSPKAEKAFVRLEIVNENGSKDYSPIMMVSYKK